MSRAELRAGITGIIMEGRGLLSDHALAEAVVAHLEASGHLRAEVPGDAELDELQERLAPDDSDDPVCPFCGRDPYHYVDIGVGMQRAAVNCCDLGTALFQYGDEQVVAVVDLCEAAASAITALRQQLAAAQAELTELRLELIAALGQAGEAYDARLQAEKENKRLRAALGDATAHLIGAASAYRRFAKRHRSQGKADTDALFSTRVADFCKAADRARATLTGEPS